MHLVCSLIITGDLPERNENVNILVACEWHLNDVSEQNIPVRVVSPEYLYVAIPFRSGAVILDPALYQQIRLEDALSFIVSLHFLSVSDLPKLKRNTFFDSYLKNWFHSLLSSWVYRILLLAFRSIAVNFQFSELPTFVSC